MDRQARGKHSQGSLLLLLDSLLLLLLLQLLLLHGASAAVAAEAASAEAATTGGALRILLLLLLLHLLVAWRQPRVGVMRQQLPCACESVSRRSVRVARFLDSSAEILIVCS